MYVWTTFLVDKKLRSVNNRNYLYVIVFFDRSANRDSLELSWRKNHKKNWICKSQGINQNFSMEDFLNISRIFVCENDSIYKIDWTLKKKKKKLLFHIRKWENLPSIFIIINRSTGIKSAKNVVRLIPSSVFSDIRITSKGSTFILSSSRINWFVVAKKIYLYHHLQFRSLLVCFLHYFVHNGQTT